MLDYLGTCPARIYEPGIAHKRLRATLREGWPKPKPRVSFKP